MTPRSELMRPPSNAALIFFVQTAGNETGRVVSLFMAGAAFGVDQRWIGFDNQIPRCFNQLRHARQPHQLAVMNKTG